MGHVGDVDPEPVVPVRQPLDGDGVVEVPGVFAVDGDGRHGTEIGAAANVLVLDDPADASRLDHCSFGVHVGDADACG